MMHKILLIAMGFAAMATHALEVEVFTADDLALTRRQAIPQARIYRVDGLRELERVIGELPGDPATARRLALARLAAVDQQALSDAAEGLVKAALHYRLDRYPAIVFDGRYVIYGVTDLALARRIYEDAINPGERP
ncbi:MAG TPA: DUF1525 domain-containing protein [Rhodobacteraceae bacterium]|nr:DUF1525 domain-containing protein [Paracoccaceae bacterium]